MTNSDLPHICVFMHINLKNPVYTKRVITNKSKALKVSNNILMSYFYCSPPRVSFVMAGHQDLH